MREVELRVVNKARNVSAKFETDENDCKTTYETVLGSSRVRANKKRRYLVYQKRTSSEDCVER